MKKLFRSIIFVTLHALRLMGLALLTTLPLYHFITALSAATLDQMTSPWTISVDTSTVADVTISENANKINYNFNSGNYVEINKNTLGNLDVSSYDAFRFQYKGSGMSNHLKLQVYDTDGSTLDRTFKNVTDTSQWTEMLVPFNSLTHWPGTGNGVLDADKISKIAFAVAPSIDGGGGGSGTIAIDKIESLKLNTPNFFLLDSFNFGCAPNDAGGNEGVWAHDCDNPIAIYDKANKYEGLYALSLTYNFVPPLQYCGYYIFLSSAGDSGCKDLSSYSHLNFYIKSDVAGKKLKIEIKDNVGSKDVPIISYLPTGTATSYQEVSIPLSDFAGLNKAQVKQIVFTFDQTPQSGIIYIDYITFTKGASISSTASSIDDMDLPYKISGWANYGKDEDSDITTTALSNITGYDGDAIQLQYSFKRVPVNTSDWAVLERNWGVNISTHNALKFQYKGSGANNNLWLKIGDKNGTFFGRKFFDVTDTSNIWKEITVPFNELSLFASGKDWQGNTVNTLDLTKINSVYFTVSKSTGGAGVVSIKNLECMIKSDYETENRENKIIKSLKVTNSSFSPNGDGIKDSALFAFTLAENADVKFVIYDLAGKTVFKTDWVTLPACVDDWVCEIEWTGTDNSNNAVDNGMYFYQLTAKTATKEDKITRVVAVFR